MMSLFINACLLTLVLLSILWIASVFIKNVSIVDIYWGFGFVVVNTYYCFMHGDFYTRKLLILLLVAIWGLRLTIYLTWRNGDKEEDFRYQEFRKKYGKKHYWWISYFQVFILQGILIMLVSLPLLGINYYTIDNSISILDYIAILLWIIGISFESISDVQLAKFRLNPENSGKVLQKGLWKYTRHPNYFGDSLVWWAYGLFCIASGVYWPIIGSIVMTILLLKVSEVSLLEKTLVEKKKDYSAYIEETNAFIPWFPKKHKENDELH